MARSRALRRPYLRVAGEGAGFVLDVGLAGEGIVGDGELGLAQALDLVAQAGGGLELEVGGGLAHLLFHVGDDGLEVVADQRWRSSARPASTVTWSCS